MEEGIHKECFVNLMLRLAKHVAMYIDAHDLFDVGVPVPCGKESYIVDIDFAGRKFVILINSINVLLLKYISYGTSTVESIGRYFISDPDFMDYIIQDIREEIFERITED